jgi:hypothetical protein
MVTNSFRAQNTEIEHERNSETPWRLNFVNPYHAPSKLLPQLISHNILLFRIMLSFRYCSKMSNEKDNEDMNEGLYARGKKYKRKRKE